MRESVEPTVKVCPKKDCLKEYTGTTLTHCVYDGTPLEELHKPQQGPVQTALVDFGGFKAEIFQRFDNMERLIKDQRTTIAVKDNMLATVLEKNQALERAYKLIKAESKVKVQSAFHNRPAEEKFGLEVLEKFLELWPRYDEVTSPNGIWWKTVAACFPGRERSVIRRLNELAKKHGERCAHNKEPACAQEIYGFQSSEPPLKWTVGGYYLINPDFGMTEAAAQ